MENPLTSFAQKALYLGMGIASLAADKATSLAAQLGGLRKQAQGLVDELVERGAMSAEEARAYMDNLLAQAPAKPNQQTANDKASANGPRKITIDDMGDGDPDPEATALALTEAAHLRQKIDQLQAELNRIKKQG
ncbi:MAG: hypothetical protein NW237_12135 [Cyanobacteriota bacterium]|nr:hypothetical protein [Cyanobacteriota bacterium]